MRDLTCDHEWGPVSMMPGSTDMETRRCSRCGLRVVRQLPLWEPIGTVQEMEKENITRRDGTCRAS